MGFEEIRRVTVHRVLRVDVSFNVSTSLVIEVIEPNFQGISELYLDFLITGR